MSTTFADSQARSGAQSARNGPLGKPPSGAGPEGRRDPAQKEPTLANSELEQRRGATARAIMRVESFTLSADLPIQYALSLLQENQRTECPVLDTSGSPVGLFGIHEVLEHLERTSLLAGSPHLEPSPVSPLGEHSLAWLEAASIDTLMLSPPPACEPDCSLLGVLQEMRRCRHRSLLVVEGDRLLGVIDAAALHDWIERQISQPAASSAEASAPVAATQDSKVAQGSQVGSGSTT